MVGYQAAASLLLLLASSTSTKAKPQLRETPNYHLQETGEHNDQFVQETIESTTFEPAISLEEFANVDPDRFEWVNPDEIQAGAATCGFLNAKLGAIPTVAYPRVKVYVCVKFAKNQPAPRGNIAVHCGGPGTLSGCVFNFDVFLGPDNAANYNIIAFDQRGMGRSLPTFANENCTMVTNDPEFITKTVQFDQPETIRDAAKVWAKRSVACWNHPEFKMTLPSGRTTYHFLEYSGTRQLAEDIERVRVIFGNQKISVYGISYGTKVMGLYATMFSEHVNLMVLDGNMDPGVDIEATSIDDARSRNHRFEYFLSACEREHDKCPVDNMRHCIAKINDIIKDHADEMSDIVASKLGQDGEIAPSQLTYLFINDLYLNFQKTPTLCKAAEAGNYEWIKKSLIDTKPQITSLHTKLAVQNIAYNTESTPTIATDEWPFPNYNTYASDMGDFTLISQDFTFGAYDEDSYVDFLFELNKKYSGGGTQSPIQFPYVWYSVCYQWPSVTPPPPIGNPTLKGIIAGQMYDPNTSYIATQKMRENFPSASLLTSRSVNHGMASAQEEETLNPACQNHITAYLASGIVLSPDGTVCESDNIEDSCTIQQVVEGSTCNT